MKLNQVKTKTINAATPALLDSGIAAFVQTAGEATFISFEYEESAGNYSVLIIYTQ